MFCSWTIFERGEMMSSVPFSVFEIKSRMSSALNDGEKIFFAS
jgi:hypothetical protein